MAMIDCPHPHLCGGVRRHRDSSDSRQACAARGGKTRPAMSLPPLRSLSAAAAPQSGFLRYDEVTKEYNPELYRVLKRTPKHWFDKKTGRVSIFKPYHREVAIGDLEDDEVVRWFTQGSCGVLALAVHERTGWPLVIVRHDEVYGPGSGRTWSHIMVRHPSGQVLDITGLSSEDSACQRWGGWGKGVHLQESTLEEVTGPDVLTGDASWHDEHERALINDYARLLIERANEEEPDWS